MNSVRTPLLSMWLSMLLLPAAVVAQVPQAPRGDGAVAAPPEEGDFRNLSGYVFPALAQTSLRMQILPHAMRLRDYCSDTRVPDAFVRVQLARFSLITGRSETCVTLLDY